MTMPRYSPISTPNSTACRSAFQWAPSGGGDDLLAGEHAESATSRTMTRTLVAPVCAFDAILMIGCSKSVLGDASHPPSSAAETPNPIPSDAPDPAQTVLVALRSPAPTDRQ